MKEWRPIKTAPRDMIEVLVYAPDESPPVFTARIICGEWGRSSAGIAADKDDFFGDPPFKPTRWMPLPEPPKK